MTRRAIGLTSAILMLVIGFGAIATVPAAHAETKGPAARLAVIAKRELAPADQTKLQTLKALCKQIGDTAKLIRDKVKAAKAAGKDLTTFVADLKTARTYAAHRAVSHGIMLTDAERTTLEAMQTTVRSLEKTLRIQRKAKALQTALDAIKAQIKTAAAARTAYLKAIHAAALTQYSSRLDVLIADAGTKLAFLNFLLARLP